MKVYNYNLKAIILLGSIIILVFSIIIRLDFIFQHAMFMDEAPNLSEAVVFTSDLFKFPPNLGSISYDIIKPAFYRILFGISIIIGNFLVHQLSIDLPSGLVIDIEFARLSMLFLNFSCYIFLLKKNWKINPVFSFFLILFVSLDPLLIFNTSIAETGAFIIPIMLVYIYLVSTLNVSKLRGMIPLSVTFAMLESVQYYSVIFLAYAIVFIIVKWRFYPKSIANEKIHFRQLLGLLTFMILISFIIFLAINPTYWLNPFITVRNTLKEVTFPLSTSSGVYGLNVFFLGHAISNTPWYAMLYYLILQVPIPIFLMFFIGLYFIFSSLFKYREWDKLTEIGLISFIFFLGNLCFTLLIPHFRGVASLSVLLLPPLVMISAIGIEKLSISIYYRSHPASGDTQKLSFAKQLHHVRILDKFKKFDSVHMKHFILLLLIIILIGTSVYTASPNFTYSNVAGKYLYHSGANIDGSLDSGQADMLIAKYMNSHNITNTTVISLALTPDIYWYANNNTYIQFWPTNNPVNSSFLSSHYFSDYLVVDEYYCQLYGNPVIGNSSFFPLIKEFQTDGGYSILYHIGRVPMVNRSSIIASFPVEIINNSTDTSSSHFVNEIVVNSTRFSNYELPNLTNVEFSFPNGIIIPSYLQSGNY